MEPPLDIACDSQVSMKIRGDTVKYFLRIALLSVAMAAGCAPVGGMYQRLAHPSGDFVIVYPADWERSWNMQTGAFHNPAGKEVRIDISRHPGNFGDSATPEAYIESTIKDVRLYGGVLGLRETIKVSGRAAERLETTLKHGWVDQRKSYSYRLISYVDVIVPHGGQFYVLSLAGPVDDVALLRPDFDRLVASFRLGEEHQYLTEWRGQYDGPNEAKMMVARNPDEFRGIAGIFGAPTVSKLHVKSGVDFGTHMLVAISMGQRPTGGYAVSIEDTIERDGVLYVRYREQTPKGGVVTQALTSPYHLKLLPASPVEEVRFEKIIEQ
jgi:hypothetical protein